MVEEDAGKLQVDPLAAGSRADEHARAVWPSEPPLSGDLSPVIASFQDLHADIFKLIRDCAFQRLHAAEIRGEDDDLLNRVFIPDLTQSAQQLGRLRLWADREYPQ